jgi:hypothetical protein
MDVCLMDGYLVGVYLTRRTPHGCVPYGRVPRGRAPHECVPHRNVSRERAPHWVCTS